jgi:hypothetical protein
MAEKTKKPVKLRKRAPEVVKDDRFVRGRQAGQMMKAARTHLRSLHGTAEEEVEDIRERAHEPPTKPIPEHPAERGMPRLYVAGLSDIDFTINGEIIDLVQSRVASRWTIRALHTGDFLGIPATSREVTFTGVSLCLTEGERVKLLEPWVNRLNKVIEARWIYWVTERWDYWDLPGLVAQLRDEAT